MGRREITAICLGVVYLAACVWALWDRLDAVLLFAVVSPVAASLMFPKDSSMFSRLLIGAFIDGFLAALAFVPVLGDLIDVGAAAVALVLLFVRIRQFVTGLPGGLACVVLYAFLWFEARPLPVAASHHAFWFYPAVVIASVLVGGVLLVGLVVLLGLLYGGDRAKAIFCAVGFPWYLITFFLTIFLPNRDAERLRQAVEPSRRD